MEPADEVAVTAVGEPGQRQFFLLARGGGETVALACEKFHIEGLITRVRQLLEAHGLPATPAQAEPIASQPEAEWAVAELGLGYHETRNRFVIVAREQLEEEGDEPAVARFWTEPDAMRRFLQVAGEVLSRGRATCPRCGLPMDPSGHPCPALNGSRPIL